MNDEHRTAGANKWVPPESPLTREYEEALVAIKAGEAIVRAEIYDLALRLNRKGCMGYADNLLRKARLI